MFGFTTEQFISGLVNRTAHHDFLRVTLDGGEYVVSMEGDDGWVKLMRVDDDGVVRATDNKLPHAFLSLVNNYLNALGDVAETRVG